MDFSIVKEGSDRPLYLQIKDQIKQAITDGELASGKRLPTERKLAEQLGVSRNTVSTAYRELEAEGYVLSRQGQGTFVAAQEDLVELQTRKERLLRIIDLAIEEALELGFSISDFVSLTHLRAREESAFLSKVKVAFVECNQEQLNYFTEELKLGSGIAIIPLTVDDCREKTESYREVFTTVDLVVTTFYHYEEVKEMLADTDKEVLSVSLEPELKTITRIARIPDLKKLGLVSISENFAREVEKSLYQAGLDFLKIRRTTTQDQQEIADLLSEVDAVVTSPNRHREIKKLAEGKLPIIEFIYVLDNGSINMLKSRLIDLKKLREM